VSDQHAIIRQLTSTGNWPYCPICCEDNGSLEPEDFSLSIGGGFKHMHKLPVQLLSSNLYTNGQSILGVNPVNTSCTAFLKT